MQNQYFARLKTLFKVITFVPVAIVVAVSTGILLIGKIVFVLLRYIFLNKKAAVAYYDPGIEEVTTFDTNTIAAQKGKQKVA